MITNTDYISSWKSKGLSAESIKPPTTSNNGLTPALNYYCNKLRVKFPGRCLKQQKISYTPLNIVNIYIVYEFGPSTSYDNDHTLKNCLLSVVTLTKNTDIEKHRHWEKIKFFISRWWISSPCINFWSRYRFFCSYWPGWVLLLILIILKRSNTRIRTYFNWRKNVLD